MEFCWFKVDGSYERIETTNKAHLKKGAANYLAKNLAETCGADLARLSEAQRWLSVFRLDETQASQRRYQAIRRIIVDVPRFVRLRYTHLFSLSYEGDSAERTMRNAMKDAAVKYAISYESVLLTSRPFLNPLVVRNDEVLPELQPRQPEKVVNAILSIPSGPRTGMVWTRDELRRPIATALDKLYPVGRSWIEWADLEEWHDILYSAWKDHLVLLPLAAAPNTALETGEIRQQTSNCPPATQPTPSKAKTPPAKRTRTTPVPAPSTQPSSADAMDIEEQEDPELSQPVITTPEDDKRHARFLDWLEAAVNKPMPKLTRNERECLIALRNRQIMPEFLNPSHTNMARADVLRQTMQERRHAEGREALRWAELLSSDGFELRDLPGTIARATGVLLEGYQFQIRETLAAWTEYRLCAVEVRLPGDLQPWPRGDRYIDTLEWVAPGDIRFREYKAYDPQGEPLTQTRNKFIDQLTDYWAVIGNNLHGFATEYVFAHGVPAWAYTLLAGEAPYFMRGLYVTDYTTGQSQRLGPHPPGNPH